MAITVVSGARTTLNVNTTTHPLSVYPNIWNPEKWKKSNRLAPLVTLMANLGKKESVGNYKYQEIEDVYRPREGTAASTENTTATTFDVDSAFADYVHPTTIGGATAIMNVTTEERMLVTGVSTDTLTVIRNYGDTVGNKPGGKAEGTGVAITTGDKLIRLADTYPEGTVAPASLTTQKEFSYNYVSLFKRAVQMTGSQSNMDSYGGKDLPYQRKKMGEEIKQDMEFDFWMSNRGTRTDATSSTRYSTTGGVFQHLQGNELDISGAAYSSGTLTAKVLDEWGEKLYQNGSGVRYVFTSFKFINAVGSLKRGITRVDDKGESFGTMMAKWTIPIGGEIIFVCSPNIFASGELDGYAVALDPDLLDYVYLGQRDIKLYLDILKDNNYDGVKDEWRGECGLRMRGFGLDHSLAASSGRQRSVHGLLKGFSSY